LNPKKFCGPAGNRKNASARWNGAIMPAWIRIERSLICVRPAANCPVLVSLSSVTPGGG